MPHPVVLVYVLASLVAFAAIGLDKRAARRNTRRTPEATLHLIELLGGVPGSLLAQQVFRHKRAKVSFFVVSWLILALHLTAWIVWWRQG